jgi:CheY-like chemotaxis protein
MKGEPLVILYVEDNKDHADLVVRTLKKHRVANELHMASDGEEALDYLFRRGKFESPETSPRPSVVLLDLRLPKVDGLEVLRIIKTTDELLRIPVVVLTSSEAEQDMAKAYDHHANSYLVKPIGFDEFTQMMEQLGFYWLSWNSYPWPDNKE